MRKFISVIVASILLLGAAAVPSAWADPPNCATYMLLGARGTGAEPTPETIAAFGEDAAYERFDDGIGDIASNMLDVLVPAIQAQGGTIKTYGTHYPATGVVQAVMKFSKVWQDTWTLGVYAGRLDLASAIEDENESCPGTKFLLVGYSQGAQVVGDAIRTISPAARNQIAATALFGDPLFQPLDEQANVGTYRTDHGGMWGERGLWSRELSSPVFSYCNEGDVACQLNEASYNAEPNEDNRFVWDVRAIDEWAKAHHQGVLDEHGAYADNGSPEKAAVAFAEVLGLSLTGVTAPAVDVVYLLDSTAEMAIPISEIEQRAGELTGVVENSAANTRYAVVDYKGHNGSDPYAGNDYVTRITQDFTDQPTDVIDAFATISASGGTPVEWWEGPQAAGYSGLRTAGNLAWRPHARKIVLLVSGSRVGDTDPYGLEAGSSLSEADAISALQVESDLEIHAITWTDDFAGGAWESHVLSSIGNGSHKHIFKNESVVDNAVDLLDRAVQSPRVVFSGAVASTRATLLGSIAFNASGSKTVVPNSEISYVWDVCIEDPDGPVASRNTAAPEHAGAARIDEPEPNTYPTCNPFIPQPPVELPATDQGGIFHANFEIPGDYQVTVRATTRPDSEKYWDSKTLNLTVRESFPLVPQPVNGLFPFKTLEDGDLHIAADSGQTNKRRDDEEIGQYWALTDPDGEVVLWFTKPDDASEFVVEDVGDEADLGWDLTNAAAPMELEQKTSVAAGSAEYRHASVTSSGVNGGELNLTGQMTPELSAIRDAHTGSSASFAGQYLASIRSGDGSAYTFDMAAADSRIDFGDTDWTMNVPVRDLVDTENIALWEHFEAGFLDELFDAGLIEMEIDGEPVDVRINAATAKSETDPVAPPAPGVPVEIDTGESNMEHLVLKHDRGYDGALFPATDMEENPVFYDWASTSTSDYKVYIGDTEVQFVGNIDVISAGWPTQLRGETIRLWFSGTVGDGSSETMASFMKDGTITFRVDGGPLNSVELSASDEDVNSVLMN